MDFLTSYNGQNHIKTFFKFHAGLWKYCRSGKIQFFPARALFWIHTWYWPYDMVHIQWKSLVWKWYEMVNNFELNGSIIEQRPTTRNVMYCQSFQILRMPFAIIFDRIIIFFIIILDVGQYYLISMVDSNSKTVLNLRVSSKSILYIRYGPCDMDHVLWTISIW